MKTVFAYIRVSTTKQGSEGASLPEQRDSIEGYCKRNHLHIVRWFEEQETAAKRGRKQFTEMMRLVKRRKADGLVFHKIDRSTRNLFEWAEVSSLPEQGIEVHYSHEPVDLLSTHGRTAADVAAVFAASYIRNLREEVKKGIQGRLKQGVYPFRAPVGYLDNGGGKVKTIDPLKGPLLKRLFERYATGEFSLKVMVRQADMLGLTSVNGTPIHLSALSVIFRNPFYTGLILIKRTGQSYEGGHEALIPPNLFKRVQDVLNGRVVPRKTRERYLFQRLLKCASCSYSLVPERQKGFLYYRCHNCRGVCIRETAVDEHIGRGMKRAKISDSQAVILKADLEKLFRKSASTKRDLVKSQQLQISSLCHRIDRLTDAFLDGALAREDYEKRKLELLSLKIEKESEVQALKENNRQEQATTIKNLELILGLSDQYFSRNGIEKRPLIKFSTSNLLVDGKTLMPQWRKSFLALEAWGESIQVHQTEHLIEHGQTYPEWQCPFCAHKRRGLIEAVAAERLDLIDL